jgi:hypothetical protein
MSHAAGDEVMRYRVWLALASSSNHSYDCSLVHSELSWWGLKRSLHLQLHVAHMHHCSHYSVRCPGHLLSIVLLAVGKTRAPASVRHQLEDKRP